MARALVRGTLHVLSCLLLTSIALAGWKEAEPLPTGPRVDLAAAAVGGKIYIFGGSGWDGTLSTVLEYDPARDSWATKAAMPTPHTGMGVAVLDGQVYLVGGNDGDGAVYAYDPAVDSWQEKASLPGPRFWLGCGVIRSKLCAIGGGGWPPMAGVEEDDPTTDTWTPKNDAPNGLMAVGSTEVDGCIYVFGGVLGVPNVAQSTALGFDPVVDEWMQLRAMPTRRQNPAVVTVGIGVRHRRLDRPAGHPHRAATSREVRREHEQMGHRG